MAFLASWAHVHPLLISIPRAFSSQQLPRHSAQPGAAGAVVTQGQDPALGLVEPHTIGLSPWIQPVQIPLQSLPAIQHLHSTELGAICKLAEGALNPLTQIINKDKKGCAQL